MQLHGVACINEVGARFLTRDAWRASMFCGFVVDQVVFLCTIIFSGAIL